MKLNPFSGGGGSDSSDSDSDDSDSSNDSGGGFFSGVQETVDDAVSGAQETVDDAADKATDTVNDVTDDASRTVDKAEKIVDNTADKTEKTVDDATRTVDRTVDYTQDTASDVANRAQNAVDDTVNRAENAADEATDAAQDTVDDAKQSVDRTVDRAQQTASDATSTAQNAADKATDTANDVASGVSRSAGEIEDATRDQVDHAAETHGEMGRELQEGDVGAAADTAVESTGETYDNLARAGDAAAGSTDEYVGSAEVNTDVTDDLTRGGVLSENRNDNSGLLPGEVAGVEISEAGFRRAAEDVDSVKDSFDENEPVTIAGSDAPERVLQGAAGAGVDLLNVPSHIVMAETGVEVAQNAPGAIQEHGAGEVAETATGVGALAGSAMASEASENPVEFTAGLGMDFITGAGIAKAGKKAGQAASRAGKTRVDPGDVTNTKTRDYYEGGGANPEDQFPGFRPEDYGTQGDPVETFRRQGEDFTPDEVKRELGDTSDTETYATHGTNYNFDSEFEAGIEKSRPSDPDDAMFVGPELSPNFAGFSGGGSSMSLSSLKPRLPRVSDFRGSDKQMVASKMDVDKVPEDVGPEARTGDSPMAPGDESQFLADEAESGRAYVRNAENRNQAEAEALVPGGSTFREMSPENSRGYYTEIDDEPVDIRLFESADDPMTSPDADAGTADGPVDESGGFYTAEEMPSSGRTTPEGTPVVPTFGGGYSGGVGGAPGAGGPMSVEETGISEQQPPTSTDSPGPADDPFGGYGDDYVLDVDDTGFEPGRSPDGPDRSDDPGSSTRPDDSGGSNSPPSSGGPDGGPSSTFIDETGVSTGPSGSPGSSGGSGSPGSSGGPSSGGPSSPGSPGSPPGGGTLPSSPPWSPPGWSTPSSGTPGSPGSPGSPSTPGSPGSPSTPGSPGSPTTPPTDPTRRPRFDFDFDERGRDDELDEYGAYDVDYSNPIASGASVLFGGLGGGFGAGGGDAPEAEQADDVGFGSVGMDFAAAQEELARQFDETGGFGP
jgi:polyhydroxyalkanoate synthesis regulator phasin